MITAWAKHSYCVVIKAHRLCDEKYKMIAFTGWKSYGPYDVNVWQVTMHSNWVTHNFINVF